jgi:CheY-like chemotaxis protein
MDLEMLFMNGLTCVRRIREMQREGQLLGYISIIAITAKARSEQIATTLNQGMVSHNVPSTYICFSKIYSGEFGMYLFDATAS